jgi:NAD(P)-dependent dehydrogenase (short-subunit alcohol dehydrogenase family)
MSADGKNFLITGAASGIGRATARLAISRGANVVTIDHDAEGLQAIGEELPSLACIDGDVREAADVDRALAAVDGRLDVLVNNAGLLDRLALVDDTPPDE